MYAMLCTKVDKIQVVGVISRFINNPGKDQWEVIN